MLERKPPTWTSILSSSTSFSALRRPTSGLDSSSTTTSSTGRPLMPPVLLMRSTAICSPTTRGLAADRARTRQRLLGADLVGLGLRRRPRATAPAPASSRRARRRPTTDDAAARDLAAVPEVLRPGLVFPLFSHCRSSLWSARVAIEQPRERAGVRSIVECRLGECAAAPLGAPRGRLRAHQRARAQARIPHAYTVAAQGRTVSPSLPALGGLLAHDVP